MSDGRQTGDVTVCVPLPVPHVPLGKLGAPPSGGPSGFLTVRSLGSRPGWRCARFAGPGEGGGRAHEGLGDGDHLPAKGPGAPWFLSPAALLEASSCVCHPSFQIPKGSQKFGSLWENSRGRHKGRSDSRSEDSDGKGWGNPCVWREGRGRWTLGYWNEVGPASGSLCQGKPGGDRLWPARDQAQGGRRDTSWQ